MTEIKIIGKMDNTIDNTFESANRVYDKDGLCPTIPTCGGGGIQPKIITETKCVGGLSDSKWGDKQYHQQDRVYKGDIALAQPANLSSGSYNYIVASRGRGENNEQRLEPNNSGCTNTITTVQKDNLVLERFRIRKLTPRECWRLMGFSDSDFDKASKVCSNTQLYKQAGNSIVVSVLEAIFRQMI